MHNPSGNQNLEALVAAVRLGEPRATDRLIAALQPFVVSAARRWVTNPADAEEIAQDSLVVVLRNLHDFSGRSSLRTWVYAIVRSQVSRKYRRLRPLPVSACLAQWSEPCDGHDEAAAWEAHRDLGWALGMLSELDRTIVLGRDLDGASARSIADEVGLSVAAIKSRLHRARESVRMRLDAPVAAQ